MPSNHSSSANSIEADGRRADTGSTFSFVVSSVVHVQTCNVLQPRPQTYLARHCSSLEEHVDQMIGIHPPGDDGEVTPRHDNRRDGFTWDSRPEYEEQRSLRGNPLPPEQLGMRTPPPLEELLRKPTNEDADSAHNKRTFQTNTVDFQPRWDRSSNASTIRNSLARQDTARSSIAGFARGIARHVPNHEHQRRASRSESSTESHQEVKKDRRLSFLLPPSRKTTESHDAPPRKPSIVESVASDTATAPSVPSLSKSSLRDRRKVNLDLTLSNEIPDLPARSRPPVGQLSSITPSRPRSPKTPWIRNEPPNWQQYNASSHTAPILEEDYACEANMGGKAEAMGLFPGSDRIDSSNLPKFERSQMEIRDRRYITRPRNQRSRSGRSGTTESPNAQTPDGNWSRDDRNILQEQEARTRAELQQLGQGAQRNRSSRWRWARSMTRSSEDIPQPSFGESIGRRLSMRPFRRSGRIADESDRGKEKMQSTSSSRAWWIGKQPVAAPPYNAPIASKDLPLPPAFVPPGLNRVPTPPMFDANGEVKGKLADFFFDHGIGIAGKKSKASPGGYWDSDALLMSYLSSDMDLEEEEEEEGPEGPDPVTPNAAVRAFTVEGNPSYGTPGLVDAPGGYVDAKNMIHPQRPGVSKMSSDVREVWFRRQQDDAPDERQLTSAALREIDERRKFEWIVPEHLPNSPLCPLHAKYQGYSKGLCYSHGRRESNGSRSKASGEFEGRIYEAAKGEKQARKQTDEKGGRVECPIIHRGHRGWEVGKADALPKKPQEAKRRRMDSLSSP
ncbi:hypothetical protein EK21DRAFT_54817 [Setomelanomma holmii]|uniref:Uncharacterized protein n=1 Tax=Setomelanomma holmii TaxID=210430 RepID=A0A9P4HHI3_9PLEO|nr:hypothetical protein EK21DRAFT_54817 [Setomelanomma holmii]